MAYQKCGGGGGMTETVLWTNSSPTSSFAEQTVTLSQDMSNFDYLKIDFSLSTSDTRQSSVIIEPSILQKNKNNVHPQIGVALYQRASSSATRYVRIVFYYSDTGIRFGQVFPVNIASTAVNTNLIPTKITGINM